MGIRFAKMHGLGNDFMVLDLVTQNISFEPEDVRRWADRHTGVGFDQLLTLEAPSDPDFDFRYRIYNADGSEVEQCGNGARCVARLANILGLSPKSTLRLQTCSGPIEASLVSADTVEVNMGAPGLNAAVVPFAPAAGVKEGFEYTLEIQGARYNVFPVSMGNPHGVIFVSDVAAAPVQDIGAKLTSHAFFPEKANIGFCEVVDAGFVRLRVFERGVGETRACGSGACAAVVAGQMTRGLGERIKVSLPGGKVRICWQGEGSAVKMTGPATLVYQGHLTF
jgi:diaminopimelate epimerase